MARNWESDFSFWSLPPSKTEEQRSENAIKGIRAAVDGSSNLNQRRIKVFTQGSYRNRVNVRQDSDVDVGVMLYDFFLGEYPAGRTRTDFGVSDAGYSFSQFKDELEAALVDHFGRTAVKRGNKVFNIRENTYHVEADVVPLFEFRQYWESGDYLAGVALVTDQYKRIKNYPERVVDYWPSTPLHYENGVSKNGGRYPPVLQRGRAHPQEDSQRDGRGRLLISQGDSRLSFGMYDLECAERSFHRIDLGCAHSGCAAAYLEQHQGRRDMQVLVRGGWY